MKDTTTKEDSQSEATGGGWMQNRTTLILAIGFVVLVLVAAAGVAGSRLLGGGDSTDRNRAGANSSTAPATSSSATPTGFAPPSSDQLGRPVVRPNNLAGQALPQSPVPHGDYSCPSAPNCPVVDAPAGMMWQQVGPFTLPFSTSDGPGRIDGPVADGYTRTPQGAALAAWQIIWRLAMSRTYYDAVVPAQVTGTAQDLESLKPTKDNWDVSKKPAYFLRPSAFRMTSWDGSHAIIQYAVPQVGGGWFSMQFDAIWADGGWKLRAPGPTENQVKTPVASLVGWTPW
ncbi:hypothetical protein [Nocardia sp. NPDC004860]|uniref:hypothetical protein n=1 Tax=Nocardia sp. NPDC004860 TaxID=3154557 RepID=UPI0033B2C065